MSIIVAIRFPMPPEKANQLVAENPEPLAAVSKIIDRHGGKFLLRLARDEEFIDLDEWPSAEVYEQFKAEARPQIDAFEDSLGVRSTDEVWTAWRGPQDS